MENEAMNSSWMGIGMNRISGMACMLLIGLAMNIALAANSEPKAEALLKADALYAAKQYTQAFEFYQALEQDGHYSPSMFLKMAHIQEGQNHLGESLYYLNLYYLASDDAQALKKMEELATKNNLEGYATDESTHILAWLQGQYITIAWALASAALFLLALMFYLRIRKKMNPTVVGIAFVIILAVLFLHVNFSLTSEHGIVAQPQTYLMSGPSAGSSVIAIIGEGHQLPISGRKDVWLRVQWKEQEVYVRENLVRTVRL